MDLSSLSPLREMLEVHGISADKRFGQHFLLDLNLTAKIVRLAAVAPGDHVLEVGPGPGGLTRSLLQAGAQVVAIEKDRRFIPLLEALAAAAGGGLRVLEADALAVDETAVLADLSGMVRVVSNLPYNIGTALLIKWLTGAFAPPSMTLMFQREVAERIVAPVGAAAYGRLSVLVQTLAIGELVMTLPARAFTPAPKVDSAVVRLTRRAGGPASDHVAALERVTAAAFGQRRKMLRSSLNALGGQSLCAAAGVDATSRAETVDIAGFERLTRAFIAASRS